MKKIIFPILLLATFISCDKVSEQEYLQRTLPSDTTGNGLAVRKVLLEDYTGHQCGNCPAANEKANELKALYGENLVVMSVHAGFFARTAPVNYTTSYENPDSKELDSYFKISAAGNPNGMVNRRDYPTTEHIKTFQNWSTLVSEELNKAVIATLEIEGTFNPADSMISATIATEFKNDYPANVKLTVYITEDSIIGYQKDYRRTPEDVPNYIHRHMLRGSINSAFGNQVNSSTTPVLGEKFTNTFSYRTKSIWKLKNLSLVAVLYNATTFEVIQVEEKHIQ